jgi:membrane dipeptidase
MAYELKLSPEQEERARRVHDAAIVVDCSIVIKYDGFLDRAQAGGVTAANHTVTFPVKGFAESALDIGECRRWIRENSDRAILATSTDDIRRAKAEGKVAVILGPQDAYLIENNLGYLDLLYDLGLRILQLTYQRRNLLGDGCGERADGGLSHYGHQVVERMNERGMVVDLSHCGWKTSADAIEASKAPVIFSHSHPHRLTPHIRNKSDELIRAMADKGGVIGISNYSPIASLESGKRPNVLDMVTHIDYVVNLVGIDHVGLGLDIDEHLTPDSPLRHQPPAFPELRRYWGGGGAFSYDEIWAEGLGSLDRFPEVTRALVSRGYSDADITKILGGNFMRVFKQVWDRK